MAHFAQLNSANEVVNVLVVADEDTADEDSNEVEAVGVAFLEACFGHDDPEGTYYKQTSYNTTNGVHRLDGTSFRLNYAGIGMIYDAGRDVFRLTDDNLPKGWTVDSDGRFAPPTPEPDGEYYWEEATETWEVIVHPEGYEG